MSIFAGILNTLSENIQANTAEKTKTSKFSDYVQFLKLRLATLVVFSASMTYILAYAYFSELEPFGGHALSMKTLMWLTLGGFLVTGASNGFNQIWEREVDKLMKRTMNRPLPTKRMSVGEAYIISIVFGVAGVLILGFFLNWLTGLMGLLSLVLYSWVYTPMKPKSPWAVLVGAFPGAMPPLLGWIAYTGEFSPQALSLFVLQFMWQFPHFWAIAWRSHEDYTKAGFKMLPLDGGKNKANAYQILFYTLLMIPISLVTCLPSFGVGGIAAAGVILLCGVIMLKPAYKLFITLEDKWATKLMFSSFIYLPLVLIALLIDKYLF